MQNRIDYEGLQNRRQMRTKKLLSQKDFFDSLQSRRKSAIFNGWKQEPQHKAHSITTSISNIKNRSIFKFSQINGNLGLFAKVVSQVPPLDDRLIVSVGWAGFEKE